MLLCMKQDVIKIVSVMAADFNSPAGAIPLERILRKHHKSIASFRERGLTWEQISRVMAQGGIKRCDGRTFPAAHIRGVFGRHRKPPSERAPKASEIKRDHLSSAAAADRHIPAFEDIGPRSVKPLGQPSNKAAAIPSGQQIRRSQPDDRAQALAVMRQSVRARRISE